MQKYIAIFPPLVPLLPKVLCGLVSLVCLGQAVPTSYLQGYPAVPVPTVQDTLDVRQAKAEFMQEFRRDPKQIRRLRIGKLNGYEASVYPGLEDLVPIVDIYGSNQRLVEVDYL